MCCIFVITLSKNLVDIFFLQKYPNIGHRLSTVGELGERGVHKQWPQMGK